MKKAIVTALQTTPDMINERAGRIIWVCWRCNKDHDLHWLNGLANAVCSDDPWCSELYPRMIKTKTGEYVKRMSLLS